MSLKDIREQIAAVLSSVEGVGVVHQYQRYAVNFDRFLELFRHANADGDQEINGWCITRTKSATEQSEFGDSKQVTHTFVIRGFFGLKDGAATELTFQDLVETIAEAFAADITLNGTSLRADYVQVDEVAADMMGNVLCHYCELTLTVMEIIEE